MVYIPETTRKNIIAEGYALSRFCTKEFGYNLKPGAKFSRVQAQDLANLYPEIFDKYWREEFYGT